MRISLYIFFCCLKILCPPKAILKIKQKFYSLGTHKYLNYKKGLNFLYNFSPRNESPLFSISMRMFKLKIVEFLAYITFHR